MKNVSNAFVVLYHSFFLRVFLPSGYILKIRRNIKQVFDLLLNFPDTGDFSISVIKSTETSERFFFDNEPSSENVACNH